MLLRLALRNLRRHPWRSVATVLGVALGIAAVLATLSVGDNVQANLRQTLEAATGPADLLVAPGAAGRAVFEQSAVPELSARPEIEAALPVLTYRAEPVSDITERSDTVVPGTTSGFQLSGRDTARPELLPATLSQGVWPEAGSGGIALSGDFASQKGLELGDSISFATQFGDVPFRVTGFLDNASGLASTNGGRVGLVALGDLQEAVRLSGRVSLLELSLADGVSVSEVKAQLEKTLGEAYTVTLPAGTGDFASGVVETLQSGLRVLAATLMALAGFMAYNTFAAAVVERTREYALLRTICLTRTQVQKLALLEAGLISLVGLAFGVLLGAALSYGITLVNASLLGYELRTLVVPVSTLLLAAGIGFAVSLAAGYLPARAASLTPPIVAARSAEDVNVERPLLGFTLVIAGVFSALSPWRGLWALAGSALSLGLLFLGIIFLTPFLLRPTVSILRPFLNSVFGLTGKLGGDFALRNAARNGVAIGAVVVGLTLTVGVGGMVAGINRAIADWVDTTIVGDLFVTSPVGFPEGFEDEALSTVPELEDVSGVGVRVVRFEPEGAERGRSVALVLVEPERFNPDEGFGRFQFVTGQGDNQRAYESLRAGGKLLAANTLLERFDVQQGSVVSVRTSEGFREFEVGGVVVDFTGGGEAFIGSLDDLSRFGGGTPDLFVMTLKAGAEPEAVRTALSERFPELYLDISLNQEYQDRILSLTQQTFYTTNALLALAIFIAALGVANTLGMNLSDRQHDIAMLRTLGLTRRGVWTLVLSEGLLLVSLGTVLGIASGVLLSRVITAGANALTGFVITPAFPWTLIFVSLIASPLVGLLASLLPARRATSVAPVLALGSSE